MNWYKRSQNQMELSLEEDQPQRRLKADPLSVSRVVGTLATMLLLEDSPDAPIEEGLKQLRQLQEEGRLKDKVGNMIVRTFNKALNSPLTKWHQLPPEAKERKKKEAYERLKEIMLRMV